MLPPHAFGGRGPKTGPDIFMTDDDSGQRGALLDTWKEVIILLCTFHFLQAVWRWLYNSSNNINRDDHQHLMGHFQKLVRTPPSSSHCKNLITRGNNSDNYTESIINIFKSVVLQRMRAYNFIELFKFITEVPQMYFQRKLLALAFGKSLSGSLVFWCNSFYSPASHYQTNYF